MGRNLKQVIADLPKDRQARIDERYRLMKDQIESLRELRKITGKAQADIAAALNIKQPSVSKIEKQADMYLSTLRQYVNAIGGELDLVVRLPKHRAVRLQNFGEALVDRTSRASARRNWKTDPLEKTPPVRRDRSSLISEKRAARALKSASKTR